MKRIKILLITITIMLLTQACEEEEKCGKTIYRPEIGIGYVFMYDTSNNVSYPVANASITVENLYWTPGMYGKNCSVAEEFYRTDADGRYQVRFIEKGCFTYYDGTKKMIYCNTYVFHYEKKKITGIIGLSVNDIKNVQNNIVKLDTIKLYK